MDLQENSVSVPTREFYRCKYCRFLDRADFLLRYARETNGRAACRMCGNASDFVDPSWMSEDEKLKILSGWYEDYDNFNRDRDAKAKEDRGASPVARVD